MEDVGFARAIVDANYVLFIFTWIIAMFLFMQLIICTLFLRNLETAYIGMSYILKMKSISDELEKDRLMNIKLATIASFSNVAKFALMASRENETIKPTSSEPEVKPESESSEPEAKPEPESSEPEVKPEPEVSTPTNP